VSFTVAGAVPYLLALALLLVWDVVLAGRIAQLRKAAPFFRTLTGLCGFLIVPALMLQAAAESALAARALTALAWFAPVVLGLFVVQSGYALFRRLVSPVVAAPIFLFNLLIAAIATVRFAQAGGMELPTALLVPGIAQSQLLALVMGNAAIAAPFAVGVPILAPAYPPRWRISNAVRGTLALAAFAALAFVATALPAAWRSGTGWHALGDERVGERMRGSFASALRILPVLSAAPSTTALHDDLALADSLDVQALFVRVAGNGSTAAALDSLGRALDRYRRDSTALLVALSGETGDRSSTVDRVVRRLKPDYLVLPAAWGFAAIEQSAADVRRLRPATKVTIELSGFDRGDSTLFARTAFTSDAVLFSLVPTPGGAARIDAALAAADRWIARDGRPREQWLLAAGAPRIDGEEAQRRLMRHAIAWSSTRATFAGVIFADAGDYDRGTGLRAADGRLRAAVGDAAAAVRALVESSSTPIPAPAPAPDPVPIP
jgi:hypothetical protein